MDTARYGLPGPGGPPTLSGRGPGQFGNGDMARMIERHDWAATPLGARAGWPQPLRTLMDVMLGAQQPMFVAWGAERTLIYNAAYAEVLGRKHPGALGQPFLEVWQEIRAELEPIVGQAFAGQSIHMDHIALVLERHGYPEETHFSFSYTPVRDGALGAVAGLFCPCTETTTQVLAERRLRESEAQASGVLEGMGEGFMLLDHSLRIHRVNAEGVRIDGRTAAEIEGRSLLELWPEIERTPAWTLLRRLLATGEAGQAAYHHLSDRHDVWLDVRAYPARNGLAVFYRDVTASVRGEQALRESEAQFRALAEAIPNHAWTAAPDGQLDWVNQQVYAYTGIQAGAVPRQDWTSAVHPDDMKRAQAAWAQALGTGDDYAVEFRIRRADGAYRWHLVRAQAILGAAGEIVQWVGTNTDIEEQKSTAAVLTGLNAELERRVAARTADRDRVWRNSRDLLAVIGEDGTVLAANPAWSAVLGYRADEVAGRHIHDFAWPEDIEAAKQALALAAAGGLVDFEKRCLHRDGTFRWIVWSASIEGDLIYAYGRDISAAKEQAEALRLAEDALRQSQKMEAVGQLTGGLAHDFNNLLAGISASLELLQRRTAQGRLDDLPRYVGAAQDSARRAAALTHRLLAFSRRQTLDPRPVDVNRLAAGMEDLIRRTVGPEIAVRLTPAAGLWTTLVDPNQLENALLNLCINARDAMPDGGTLTIETANRLLDGRTARLQGLPPGAYVSLRVTDEGSGMAAETVSRAFDPFFTTKPLGEGTGLGLSMIYGFVRQSGGQARIDSELGQGTRVTLFLPQHDAPADPLPDPAAEAAVLRGQGETVLVVDDEATIRAAVAETLREQGYGVTEATDGVAGLEALRQPGRVDLLITDVGLPGGLNGRQLADAGLALHPAMKVLFVTGYAEHARLRGGALGPGMQVLAKPFALDALAVRVRELLGA